MLQLGGWSAAVLRWARAVAEQLQGAVLDGRLGAASPALHDATTALGLVRAATAALALVSDVGFEAAVRHLSGEYFAAAAKVGCCGAGGLLAPAGASVLWAASHSIRLGAVGCSPERGASVGPSRPPALQRRCRRACRALAPVASVVVLADARA